MGFLDHHVLQIIQGVAAIPGDSNSVENPLQVLNLMDSTSGISLAPDGWSPSIPGLENSGIWADSPLSNGRTPLVMQESNVTETMNLIISSSSFLGMTKTLATINTMAINARAFWTDNAQYDPVYLKWWASCGKGPQYALIFDMNMKYEYQDAQNPVIEVTLTIERESYWRGIAPGANPKQWTYEAARQAWNQAATELGSTSTNNLVSTGTLQNKSEYNAAQTALISTNFITIPAASIPGDAPALVNLYAELSPFYNSFIMGKRTATVRQGSTAVTYAQNTTFCAPDGMLGTDASIVADTGAVKPTGGAVAQRISISFATPGNVARWTNYGLNPSSFIGRYMLFLRCRQSAGTLGDITMYMRYGDTNQLDTKGVKLNVVSPPVIAGAGNTTEWGLVYMGIIESPITVAKAGVNYGLNNPGNSRGVDNQYAGRPTLTLYAARTAGAGLLFLCDLILIPVDEGSTSFSVSDTAGVGNWLDNTGYFTHGTPDAFFFNGSPPLVSDLAVASGQDFTLTPGIENRLYFITLSFLTRSAVTDTPNFKLNIVPRWRGIRDV